MGLPIVGSTAATKGVGGDPGRHFLVGDESESQIRAVCGLLEDDEHAREIGANARSFVEEHYDWENCLAPLDGILERCAASRAAS